MLAPPPLPRTLEASLRDLSSARPNVRASAIVDLARHASRDAQTRTEAIGHFEIALRDDAAEVRSAAAVALADLKAVEALPALLVAMEDPDMHVRQMAINAVGETGDARATQRLRRALSDARPEVRYQAVIAFARVAKDDADDVTRALESGMGDDDDAVRYIALRVAEERSDSNLPARWDAIAARAAELLDDAVSHVALAAAIFLVKRERSGKGKVLGAGKARDRILSVVRSETGRRAEKEDEREAVEVAGALGMREAMPALERRAWGLSRIVRDTCAFHAKIALARLGHERATAEILRDLGAPKRETREAAVVAAGRARLTQAREAILAVKDVDGQLVADALRDLDHLSRSPE
jgi:HEAT repeat protein